MHACISIFLYISQGSNLEAHMLVSQYFYINFRSEHQIRVCIIVVMINFDKIKTATMSKVWKRSPLISMLLEIQISTQDNVSKVCFCINSCMLMLLLFLFSFF